ncbi:uncharacterized protein LOC143485385 isoform X2 [Brachyhypopomus gauderio]|uniref:uncharacterized protein LOC143485385 isoform X2 n=1 Tax=Brachyhypopomus gauderio TaxID=698409 RepID=UPI0040433522
MKMHPSICDAGVQPDIEECNTCCRKLFHCPLCPTFKPTTKGKINRHVDAHIKNGIKYKDKHLLKCRLSCRTEGHFHCPFCQNTVIRRNDMEKHLCLCEVSLNTLPLSSPARISSLSSHQSLNVPSPSNTKLASVVPPVAPPPSAPLLVHVEHSYASPPIASPPIAPVIVSHLSTVQCPHCSLVLQKKNLNTHISRKHTDVTKDITQASHLKCLCVDEKNGLFAVQRTGHGFSVPVHVQRKTWGIDHQIRCEMEECRQYHLLAQRSRLHRSLCEHIRSVDYSDAKPTEGFPSQDYGLDCGIFMLMSALYVALDAPFDYTINDMPSLRKWWCLLLMENFELDSFGKLFAHWTEESNAVLQGHHVPVSKLKKRKRAEVDQEPAVVRDLSTAVKWISQNRTQLQGHVTMPIYLTQTEEDRKDSLIELMKGDGPETKEPFMFQFEYGEDMELFLEACVDKQGLCVNAMVLNK